METSSLVLASSSDLEQQAAAALRSVTPVATAPAVAGAGAPNRAAAAAIQRRKAAQRARATAAFHHATLASVRPLSDHTSRQLERLKRLKNELRDLEVQLSETLTLQLRKESQCRLARESISEATATAAQLRTWVADFRDKRDNLLATVSEQLPAGMLCLSLEALEAEMEKMRKAVLWYEKFLGFRVIGGEGGVKFVFNKIDPEHPDKECSFRITPMLQFIECDPHVRDIENLVKDLDLNEYLFEFVRMAREKFQSFFMNDVSAVPFSSPMVMSVNNRSEDTHNQTQSQSKKNVRLLPAEREATALSGASPGVLRRSPRLKRMR